MKKESTKVGDAPPFSLNRRDGILIAILVLIAVTARLLPGPRTIDDAYITFRYARNIVEGVGFVYNPGERVLGTTTPLYATLMAAIGLFTGQDNYPVFALAVNTLADATTCVLLYLLMRRLVASRLPAATLGLLWAVAPMSVTFAIGGMETSVFILWMVATVWMYVIGRDGWAALTGALGVLTRPDAALWVGLILLHQLWMRFRQRGEQPPRRWLPWRTWLVFGAVLLPWVTFALAYFGTPVSRTAGAKIATYSLAPGATLIRLLQHFATPFFEYNSLGAGGTAVGLFLYPMLFAVGALALTRRTSAGERALPIFLYPPLYGAAFALTNVLLFRWYLAPPLPVYFMGIIGGAWVLLDEVGRAIARRGHTHSEAQHASPLLATLVFGGLATIWLGFSLNAWTVHPDHGPDRPAPKMAFIELERLYEQVGRALTDDHGVTAKTVVCAGDIGAVGYFSRARIVDTVGLVTPAASAYYPVDPAIIAPGNNYAIPAALVLDMRPDFVVIMESYGRLGLLPDPAFSAQYELIETLDTTLYESKGMLLFRRAP